MNTSRIASDNEDLRHYGCSYSKARSGFNTSKVKSVTTQQLDADQYEDDAKDDFTIVKQLIVDISTQDNSQRDEISILFEKNNKDISIDTLSTDEKQIVFRGAHLLKNSNRINGGIALIDEPELSMHPKWQYLILIQPIHTTHNK